MLLGCRYESAASVGGGGGGVLKGNILTQSLPEGREIVEGGAYIVESPYAFLCVCVSFTTPHHLHLLLQLAVYTPLLVARVVLLSY